MACRTWGECIALEVLWLAECAVTVEQCQGLGFARLELGLRSAVRLTVGTGVSG